NVLCGSRQSCVWRSAESRCAPPAADGSLGGVFSSRAIMRRFADVEELKRAPGEVLGESDWLGVSQDMIDRFAEATGDSRWSDVDREKARHSPFGTTIAHGFLTLSLIPRLLDQVYAVERVAARLNYGCNKVRFTQPVPSASRIRARIKLVEVEETAKGVRITSEATVLVAAA